MAKLYPPHIEGSLPAFCGGVMNIPFEHSRAVSPDYDIKGFYYILKDIQQSKIIASQSVALSSIIKNTDGSLVLQCPVNPALVSVGTFYKCQLAYVGQDNQIGYYSDVGIIKYIQEPEVKLTGLTELGSNIHNYHYQLSYSCKDSTEKLYSTQFIISKGAQTSPYLASDVIIHDTTKDGYYTSSEDYDFLQELSTTEKYWVYAFITTTSGYEKTTPFYPLSAAVSIPNLNDWRVKATLDFDNGCSSIYCYSATGVGMGGKFKLARADSKEKYSIWHTLFETEINKTGLTEDDPLLLWKDFTIEQGESYIYGLFQVSKDGKISTRIKSDTLFADFEDAFLFDGDKQLRIRFDPKVSSFKSTVQEVKTDTIGGRYPIIQRNGYTYYKEFPISGLISHLSDEQGYFNRSIANIKFIDNENIVTDSTDAVNGLNYTTNLNSKNIYLERQFKLEVLDWLNNGKPKLFRSPTEGNYIVRLLNVTLSPTDALGRMLHSFSCTAYEIDKMTIEKLVEHSIIKDYYLEGRIDIDYNRNYLTYYVSNLQENQNLLDNTELQDKEVTGVAFSVVKTASPVYVNINGTDVNVSESANAVQNQKITSLMQPKTHSFNYTSRDLLTLSYHNVLSSSFYNDYLENVLSEDSVDQRNGGWDMLGEWGANIKNFLQRIYKIVCNARQIFEPLVSLTADILNSIGTGNLLEWGRDLLEKLIKRLFNKAPIESGVYCIYGAFNEIVGYIDGSTCTWIKEGGQLLTKAGACIKFFYDKLTDPQSFDITKETVFTDFKTTLTNIVANPFTCIDIIYKKAVNTFNDLAGDFDLSSFATCGTENLFANLAENFEPVSLANNLINEGEQILTKITSFLASNGNVFIPDSFNDSNNQQAINDLITKTTNTITDLATKSVQVLGSANGTSSSLTDISSSVLKTFTGVVGSLFGGMC